jgi:hypothetical protein
VPDYRAVCESVDPATVTRAFAGDLTTAVNACVECGDRHMGENRVNRSARSRSKTTSVI